MALRDQPYLPLYVQDVLTDEKLIECSAEAHGIYFRLLCILHKQETYGVICLKQKYKQKPNQTINFADMLSKQMPFQAKQIEDAIQELLNEDVIQIEGDELFQKRMKKDGQISLLRTEVGKKGGSSVTKQYGYSGFLYLMSDGFTKNKIGISVNPLNRLYRLRSDYKLPKHFEIKHTLQVKDMGKSEDFAQEYFKDILDGEWLIGDYSSIENRFVLLKAKMEANSENESEYENESKIEYKKIKVYAKNCKVERDRIVEDKILLEPFAMHRRCEMEEIFKLLDLFITSNAFFEKEWESEQEFRKHFMNWMNKKPTLEKPKLPIKSIKML